jgi:hypothetical protein
MSVQLATDSPEAIMEKADEIYDRLIRSKVEPTEMGRLVAVDVDSEEYELGDEVLEVSDRLRARRPLARIGVIRVGEEAVYRIGHFPEGRPAK